MASIPYFGLSMLEKRRTGRRPNGAVRVIDPSSIDHRSPGEAKIGLFRSLFRGRDDVYARRFESRKTGKHGYAPACANEWVRGICEKPRVRCAECPNRRFHPPTDDVIRWHLSGVDTNGEPFVAGVYPRLPDETCRFLSISTRAAGERMQRLVSRPAGA